MLDIEQRLRMRDRSLKRRLLYQEWQHLLFLHWKYDPKEIQKTLPDGLFVDTFEGDAYVSIVPFFIKNLKWNILSPFPFLSDFIEVNVRTYVFDQNGIPGVWFYSLDIDSFMATFFARQFFFLPYHNTHLDSKFINNEISISGTRKKVAAMDFVFSPIASTPIEAKVSTLDFFLLERYALFVVNDKNIYMERIHHSPYLIEQVELKKFRSNLLEINQLHPSQSDPQIIHYSAGLCVDIFPLEFCY